MKPYSKVINLHERTQSDPVERKTAEPSSGLLDLYKELKPIRLEFNTRMVNSTPPKRLRLCAKSLGMIDKNGEIFWGSNEERILLKDYSIYYRTAHSKSVAERFVAQTYPTGNPLWDDYLLSLLEAEFLVFKVNKIIEAVGAEVIDWNKNRFLLVDQSLSQTFCKGNYLASRILSLRGMSMTTGASIPLMEQSLMSTLVQQLERILGNTVASNMRQLPTSMKNRIERTVIRTCLAHKAMSFIRYQ